MSLPRLLWIYLRLGILNELEYRTNFVVQVFQSLLGLGSALAMLAIVFSHTPEIGGWRPAELLALLGVYSLVGGAIRTVIQPSLERFMEEVRLGTLDFTLTKPEDSQVLVSVKQVQVWRLIDVGLGLAVIGLALTRLEEPVGPATALRFLVVLAAGGAIVYSFWLMLATLTFWFIRLENILVVFMAMWEAGRWPIAIYPPWLRHTLTFLVPVAFATTVPAEALTGRLSGETLAGAVALAVLMLVASRLFWRLGVRHYSGASA